MMTIFGNGNMGQALDKNFTAAGNVVSHIGHENNGELGESVIFAVPYPAIDDIIDRYKEQLESTINSSSSFVIFAKIRSSFSFAY